jgi:hypothetical protein
MICDKSLLLGYVMETKDIHFAIVDRCIKEIEGVPVAA